MVEQQPAHDAAVGWIIEGGEPVSGREDSRRLRELRDGLARHRDVEPTTADATDAAVERTLRVLHDAAYLDALDAISSDEPVVMAELTAPGMRPDVPISAGLISAAREGIRTAISAAERLADGARFTYAVSRPPGHHAGPAWFGGYCYLNTAAAAASTLLERGAETVGILDLDLHYPNGTAAIVAPIDRIELRSLHSSPVANAPSGRAIPLSTREQVVEFTGVPTPEDYLAAVATAIDDLARTTSAIVVSLGYDTVRDDPHGGWDFPPAIFARIGSLLAASGRPICVVQEGGYGLPTLAECSHAFASGLLNGAMT